MFILKFFLVFLHSGKTVSVFVGMDPCCGLFVKDFDPLLFYFYNIKIVYQKLVLTAHSVSL